MDKPITTLFMLSSVDWKITIWENNLLDFDKDLPKIFWVKEWLYQYYQLEQETDLFSLNSWKVLAKIWINNQTNNISKTPVNFLIIDNAPHLTSVGVENMLKKSNKLYMITTNKFHPCFEFKDHSNLEIIFYENKIDFEDLFIKLKKNYHIDTITIQTWWELNSIFLRKGLINKLSLVVAPILVWWDKTANLIWWLSLKSAQQLKDLKALKLISVDILKDSYLNLKYEVINDTNIEK